MGYTDAGFLDVKKNILLVTDTDTGEAYVKKYISAEQYGVYELIRRSGYAGVPRVIDIYPENDYFVLIEERAEGKSLQEMLDAGFLFPPEFMRTLTAFFARTLTPIHRDGIVHRDITASNVIYSGGDKFYLIDFGNARTYKKEQSADTEFIGTQNYAAPEQFGFGQSTRRTDIFAIGMLMNALLTGGRFTYEQMYEGALKRVIKRCTAVNPRRRYGSVKQLSRAAARVTYLPFTSVPMIIFYVYGVLTLLAMIIAFFI